MEEVRYSQKQEEEFERYEGRCLRCGACCGTYDGDLCRNLIKRSDNKYYCRVYENRIGQQATVSGKRFACIPIRDFLKFNSSYPNCAYSGEA